MIFALYGCCLLWTCLSDIHRILLILAGFLFHAAGEIHYTFFGTLLE